MHIFSGAGRVCSVGYWVWGKEKVPGGDFYAVRGVTDIGCWLNNRQCHFSLK